MIDIKNEKLDIRPNVNVYRLFTRLNYKPYYAIAEFVDNSTASFFKNRKIMEFNKIRTVTINIDYDADLNELRIRDDAYGMEIDDFRRAILLGASAENISGRNEFGMGLKTAASWFGDFWSVRSTQLNSEVEYYAEVDIPYMDKYELSKVEIKKSAVDKSLHGTEIVIKKLTKSIKSIATRNKIKNHLSSMYRRDLKDNVRIIFNGEELSFTDYPILEFRGKYWEKTVDFSFEYEGKTYNVDGKIGILNPGGFDKSGFSLFRNNRVIIGGLGENYKPQSIFGQAQSQISLKLSGELNMDDFEVNQAKDGFVWDGGLEEAFVEKLKMNISEYITIATMSTKERTNEEIISDDESDEVEKSVMSVMENYNQDTEETETTPLNSAVQEYKNQLEIENSELIQREYREESKSRVYQNIKINKDYSYDFDIKWVEGGNKENWLEFEKIQEHEISIKININHDFFKPFSTRTDFKVLLEKLAIAFAISEEESKQTSFHELKLIKPNEIRVKMNQILSKLTG